LAISLFLISTGLSTKYVGLAVQYIAMIIQSIDLAIDFGFLIT